jgi:hypothetical protein
MADYEIGYGKPPGHSQFRKGFCANPRGRPRRQNTEIGNVVRGFLSSQIEYREKGRTRKISRLELAIRRHIISALNVDVGSAAILLKMRAQAMKSGDEGPLIVTIVNSPGPWDPRRRRDRENPSLTDSLRANLTDDLIP